MDNLSTNIIFCDIEASVKTKKIQEIGFLYNDKKLKTSSLVESSKFIELCSTKYIAGHNFIDFDIEILKLTSLYQSIEDFYVIDTLPLSLLLFNEKTIHSLPKNYKSEDDFKNDPVEDSIITYKLFEKLLTKFLSLDSTIQHIFYSLLKDNLYFSSFFEYIKDTVSLKVLNDVELKKLILQKNDALIINHTYLDEVIKNSPLELAYIVALLTPHTEIKSHPPKILYSYPQIVDIQKKLCFDVDIASKNLSAFSKEIFGFSEFRDFPRLNATILDEPNISQREIVEASLRDESFLCILPTGGGKTFTFWLPAVYKASSYKSLTVVISPLQALIQDHINSFNVNVANFKAVAISGFMSPLERKEAIEQVVNGEADILYIAPESLRSNMIFNILKNRLIERFVIDEAHCLSTWGNDFRQDYYYICEYVKELCEKKNFQDNIPISCFTATAKPGVIQDIQNYFLDGLGIKLKKYLATPERTNLTYKSIQTNKKNKYTELLNILAKNDGSSLVYIPSSTKDCDEIAEKLLQDTKKNVKSFHSKIDSTIKMQILQDYIDDKIDIIVATTAFGMGVDKSNIINVIHYEISDSLENYAQEAGRGARNQKLTAHCPILFDENDMDKHFASLNRSKLTASEINSIFRVIKNTKNDVVNKTAFEFAKEAGWDVEDSSFDFTTKVKTALLELEREGYINRKRNKTNFFADSIASDSFNKLHKKLESSNYTKDEKQRLISILQTILGNGKVESVQIDELAYLLGYEKHDVALCINQLKDMEILGDSKDLSLEISKDSINKFKKIIDIEILLFEYLVSLHSSKVAIRELNEYLHNQEKIKKNESELIKSIIKNWKDKSNFLFMRQNREQDLWYFEFLDTKEVKDKILKKHQIASKLLDILVKDLTSRRKEKVEFSLIEMQKYLVKYSLKDIDKTLLYLHHLKMLELLNGRFINYSPMSIYKNENSYTKRKYTSYKVRLEPHYKTKIESIHIMGEYAKRLKDNHHDAMKFLKDYFTLDYKNFIKQYNLVKEKIARPITQKRFDKIYANMSDEQKKIIEDKTTKAMMILAGPGSGKTKVLVHKIASLILTEDVKPEQFMMLTFSKSAKNEFKNRLYTLIGSLSYDVEIQTFHSFALKLIARDTKNDKDILARAIEEATNQIKNGDITLPYITVLILDEYQDINEQSFEFVKEIYNAHNKELRIIAVGDDDQCIMDFAGADVKFIKRFEDEFSQDDDGKKQFKKYELLSNFRSDKNIVKYANDFRKNIQHRFKEADLHSKSTKDGEVSIYNFPNANNLATPVVELIKQKDTKEDDIAILAFTNDEVMQIYSLLQENKIDAKYIIERDKFELKNIIELFEFDKIINSYLSDETTYKERYFDEALKIVEDRYVKSLNIKLLYKIVNKFIDEHDKYYISHWLSYLHDIKLEDFENNEHNIIVSTIHKSKGMEFDTVFLLNNKNSNNNNKESKIRVYYVGMTRAKHELYILKYKDNLINKKDYINYINDNFNYIDENKVFTYVMGLGDISLGFDCEKYTKNNFVAGFKVLLDKKEKFKNFCIFYQNRVIGILSNNCHNIIDKKFNEGFLIDNIFIENVVMWHDKDNEKYLKHPLCKIIMKRFIK